MKVGEFAPTKVANLQVNNVAQVTYGTTILDMAYDYSTHTMYALGYTTLNMYFSYVYLYKIDLNTGTVNQVGTKQITGTRTSLSVSTLACDLEGNLYCVERGNAFAELYKIELVDGEPVCTCIGNTGFGSAQH